MKQKYVAESYCKYAVEYDDKPFNETDAARAVRHRLHTSLATLLLLSAAL